MGFGYSGTLELHYQSLRKRYAGCTYVHGNLEITNLDDPVLRYDLGFLSTIKYVSGYVLIGLITQVRGQIACAECHMNLIGVITQNSLSLKTSVQYVSYH